MVLTLIVPVAPANAPVPPVTLPLVTTPVLGWKVNVPYRNPPLVSIVTFTARLLGEVAAKYSMSKPMVLPAVLTSVFWMAPVALVKLTAARCTARSCPGCCSPRRAPRSAFPLACPRGSRTSCSTASHRGRGTADWRRSGTGGGFQHEHRDLPGGLLLVLGVGRVGGHRPLPPLRPLVAGDLPRDHGPAVRAVLKLHLRVRPEVVVPQRVGRGTALRGHRRVPAVMLDPHQRGLAQLAAPDPAVGDDHHGEAGVA